MNEAEYRTFCARMVAEHAISSTRNRRNGMEMEYFRYHKARGVKLRGKYRPQ